MKTLTITECTIRVINKPRGDTNPLVGFARVTFEGQLVINGIRIVLGAFGHFITWPREYKRDENKAYNIVFPITKDLQEATSARVLQEFQQALTEQQAEARPA